MLLPAPERRPGPDDPLALFRGLAWAFVLAIPLYAVLYLVGRAIVRALA